MKDISAYKKTQIAGLEEIIFSQKREIEGLKYKLRKLDKKNGYKAPKWYKYFYREK